MKCMKCNAPVLPNRYCSECGVKVDYYKKAYNTADYFYNMGLEKAQVRDLSGAIEDLKKALKYNKCHTDARNLLGLIYYEMGEIVLALSEWVVSNHFQPNGNEAAEYLNEVQANPSRLEAVNQTIKKYNQTLSYIRQGSFDLAMIQLRKVLNLAPNFVNGQLLLALLYIKEGSTEKALKLLKKVLKIDAHNTRAFNYLKELEDKDSAVVPRESKQLQKKEEAKRSVNATPVGKYKEPPSGMRNLVYIVIGMVVMAVVMWILIIPSASKSLEEKYKKNQTTVQSDISAKTAEVAALQDEKKQLEADQKKLESELEQYKGKDGKNSIYDQIFLSLQSYLDNDIQNAALLLLKVNEKELDSDAAKQMYATLSEKTFQTASTKFYSSGWASYNAYKYEDARDDFKKAYELNDQNTNALYFLARSYHNLGDNKNAKKYYNKVVTDFPNTTRANEAKQKLASMGG